MRKNRLSSGNGEFGQVTVSFDFFIQSGIFAIIVDDLFYNIGDKGFRLWLFLLTMRGRAIFFLFNHPYKRLAVNVVSHDNKMKNQEVIMWNIPSKERLAQIPKLYETEKIPLDKKLIYLHFFIGRSDWYISEFDGEDIFFGFAILNGDTACAEWGYVSFAELRDLKIGLIEVDCELEECWNVRQFGCIKKLCD